MLKEWFEIFLQGLWVTIGCAIAFIAMMFPLYLIVEFSIWWGLLYFITLPAVVASFCIFIL